MVFKKSVCSNMLLSANNYNRPGTLIELQNHRMAVAVRALWGSSSPTTLLKLVHIELVA